MSENSSENKKITIITHSGKFHADDIFAVATLLLLLGEEASVSVIRSRDEEIIKSGDYVVDVGGVYDPDKNRFDHHQQEGAGIRNNTVPYASFGLVWKKFGETICGLHEVSERIDHILVQPIDMADNGRSYIETSIPGLYPYDIGLFFNAFTPSWKETEMDIDTVFMEVVQLARIVLTREISKRKDLANVRSIIENIYKESLNKKLIVLDQFYPVGEVLSKFPEPLFVVFPREDGIWAIKTIRNDENSFINRKDLPKDWAGKKDEEFETVTGVVGAVFCHKGLFLAGAKTKEAILQLAEIALNS
ncbi:MYG1 family protein [Patescibacteria group bacterium]|nr:MYG1 family protein [Patescibacteria group bacterium]